MGLATSSAVTIVREVALEQAGAAERALDEGAAWSSRPRAIGTPVPLERGQQLERRPAGVGVPCSASSMTRSCSSSISALALAGALEHRLELGRGDCARGPEQRALVLHRERASVAAEQVDLGARPGLLGVEQQAVVVEDDRVEGGGHGGR